MNTIKTWQERCSTDPTFPSSDKAMQAEIAELRAALAARATSAQPAGDLAAALERAAFRKGWEARPQPSPSSVGAAIRALPLPEPLEIKKLGIRGQLSANRYGDAQLRELLSEAAALAEQVQGWQWISVEDRLPETLVYDARPCKVDGREIPPAIRSHKVLVSLATGVVREDYLDGLQGHTPFWSNFRDSVIAWQPMPPAAAPSIAQDGQKSEGA
jgi:hypothetical protein